LPVARFVEAVELSRQPHSDAVNPVTRLCDWWNNEPQVDTALRCAGVSMIWVSNDGGRTYTPAHPYHGPAEPVDLFLQASWRACVAACGDCLLVVFLKDEKHFVLDAHGFFMTYLVNGVEYESLGIDYLDFNAEARQALCGFPTRFPAVYASLCRAAVSSPSLTGESGHFST
jgi:hypothetical protein